VQRPNTRMQRTRSSPSALRSPLMRCPLGGQKLSWCYWLVFAALLVPLPLFGCDCEKSKNVNESLAAAAAVFTGVVTNVELRNDGSYGEEYEMTLAVCEAWKGVKAESVVVRTSAGCCACGLPLTAGHAYLVYASYNPVAGALWTSQCSRSGTFETAAYDLEHLGVPSVDFEVPADAKR